MSGWLANVATANSLKKEWSITLRDDVSWSDGESFDADDVFFTAKMILDHDHLTALSAVRFRSQVESVEKVDDLTVRFKLHRPNPRFPSEFLAGRREGAFLVMPEHIWKDYVGTDGAGNVRDPAKFDFNPPVGTGPFKFKSASDTKIVLERNPDWWAVQQGLANPPEPDELVWVKTDTVDEAIEKLVNNELDVGPELTVEQFEAANVRNPNLIAWQDTKPITWPDPCALQLDFNTQHKIWRDATMRKAIAHFIDRSEIVERVYNGQTSASTTMFPAHHALSKIIEAIEDAGLRMPDKADIPSGESLLAAAGYAKGADGIFKNVDGDLTIKIHVNTISDKYVQTVDLVVEQLNKAGIAASTVKVDNDTYWARVVPKGGFQMAHGWFGCGSMFDPWTSLYRYHSKHAVPIGNRSPGYRNMGRWGLKKDNGNNDHEIADAFSAKVDEIGALKPGDTKIPGLVVEAYRKVIEDMPFIPLVQAPRIIPFNTTNWKGWPTATNPTSIPIYWWGQTQQMILGLKKAN